VQTETDQRNKKCQAAIPGVVKYSKIYRQRYNKDGGAIRLKFLIFIE
jgi:hypothetical protein